MSVELAINFNYSYLNFILGVCNEFNDNWQCVIVFFKNISYCVEILRINCCMRRRLVQVKNLFLELEMCCGFFLFKFNLNTYITCTCTKIVK
jgi:hypothetical protein